MVAHLDLFFQVAVFPGVSLVITLSSVRTYILGVKLLVHHDV